MKSMFSSRSSAALLIFLACAFGHAHAVSGVPEIDSSLTVGGLGLLSGVVLMIKGRRRKS